MTYKELLKNAPPHNSPEFLDYLREFNKVEKELDSWLIIHNFKYDSKDRPWYTAFLNNKYIDKNREPISVEWGELMKWVPDGYCVMRKKKSVRTVKRYHVHIFKYETP